MGKVLTVDLDAETLDVLREHASLWDVELEHHSSAEWQSRLTAGPVELLVVGNVGDPIRVAQRAHMRAPGIPVLLLATREQFERLREHLRFSVFVGPEVRCVVRRPSRALIDEVGSAIDRSRRRDTHRRTVRVLNRQLGQNDRPGRPDVAILGRLLEIAPIGVAITDEEGRIEAVNPRAETIFEVGEERLLGAPIASRFAQRDRERMREIVRASNGELDPPRDTLLCGKLQVEVTVSPVPSESGPMRRLIVMQDVTERSNLIEQLQEANQRKDLFLAMLGHELRNPLAPIRTALELMRLRGDERTARERAVIERQVAHMVQMVDDLLDVARITRGTLPLHKTPVEASAFVAEAVEIAAPLLEQRQHQLSVQVPGEGLRVYGDPARLAQVMTNLLTNAAKYTPDGGKIDVRARAEGGKVVIAVRDTGSGIEPDILPTIFEPFVQKAQSLDRSTGGLGIGLPIVRSIVRRHDGTVTVSSQIGQGSEFVVTLPLLEGEDRVAVSGERSKSDSKPGPSADAYRILVVDDNEDAATLLADLLQVGGYETAVAHDGPSAIEVARKFLPHAGLLDIGLPVMDGYELAQRIHAQPQLADIPLIALTGYDVPADRSRTKEAGFSGHLVKPISAEALYGALERTLSSTSQEKKDPDPG